MRKIRLPRYAPPADEAELVIRLTGNLSTAKPTRRAIRRGQEDAATAVVNALRGRGHALIVPAMARLVRASRVKRERVPIENLGPEDEILAPLGAMAAIPRVAPPDIPREWIRDLQGAGLAEALGHGKGVNMGIYEAATLVEFDRPTLLDDNPTPLDRSRPVLTISYYKVTCTGVTVTGVGQLEAALAGENLELRPEKGWLRVVTEWIVPGERRSRLLVWRVPEPGRELGEPARRSLQAQWLDRRSADGDAEGGNRLPCGT